MSQNDYTIANQSAPDFRSDLNDALQALASLSSGSSAPSTTYANMLWYDTANNILKMRTEADDAWINVGYLDQSANAFRIFDDTQVVNTSGTQTGLLGGQATSVWEDGTSTTRSLVSPAEAKAAIEAIVPPVEFTLRTVDSGSLPTGFPVITGLPEDGWFLKLNDVTVGSSSTRSLTVRFSSDNGSSFYGWRTISPESFWNSVGVSGGISGSNPPSFESVTGNSSSARFENGLMIDATVAAFDPSTKINALQLGFDNGQRTVSGGTYELIGGTRFSGWIGS
jgi:hypothetical protein